MYITNARFILKTCGTTTLMHAVKPLLSLVESHLPGTVVSVRYLLLQNRHNVNIYIYIYIYIYIIAVLKRACYLNHLNKCSLRRFSN